MKNEEEYLERAVLSIIALVDELVIVDNASDDATPELIAKLVREYPAKIKAYTYPHKIARYGDENIQLAATREGRKSPALLANYYNWSASKCSHPYILKWDGDTVATDALEPALQAFRKSRSQILWYTGINLHESREYYISGRPLEDVEPRLFYKRFSHYGNYLGYVEALWSPYLTLFSEYSERVTDPLYFHLKFCKRDRFSNISENLKQQEERNASPGAPLPQPLKAQIAALRL